MSRQVLMGCAALLVSVLPAAAGERETAGQPATTHGAGPVLEWPTAPDCGRCHSCNSPMPASRCLLSCTRHGVRPRAPGLSDGMGPDVVILDELENAYLPVPFDHKGHARMAEMGDGCVTCHHYTPEGRQHPACKTCHDISAAGTDINKPGLKGAYHQQCLNCHRDWTDDKDCDICHRRKAGEPQTDGAMSTPTKDDVLGQMHPPIPEPQDEFYRSRSVQPADSRVVFRHQEHVHRFGLSCVDCHHEPSCTRCHARDKTERPRTLVEHHRPCIRCHKHDMDLAGRSAGRCERCHWAPGQPEPEPFNHAGTGWPLSRFHENVGCRGCHDQVPFVKLERNCSGCHGGWSPSTFNHRVTGQTLDGDHAEHDCASCHVDLRFDRPPTCHECHDEEDGITFPARRPGPVAE